MNLNDDKFCDWEDVDQASAEEMETFLHTVIDTLPGVVGCSCNIILSRVKDIKGLRL